MSSLQEIEDVFFEVRSRIDLSLIEERRRAARSDLPSDLFRDPSILAAVAHENEALFGRLLIHWSALLYLKGAVVPCIPFQIQSRFPNGRHHPRPLWPYGPRAPR